MFDREEDYRGAVTVVAESLPPGVSAAVGADFEPDKDAPPLPANASATLRGRNERLSSCRPNPMHATAEPQKIRLVVRPLVDGKIGGVLSTKTIYLMVIDKP